MKVLLINNYHYRKGGSETVYFETGKLIEESGNEVMFLSVDDPEVTTKKNAHLVYSIDYMNGSLYSKFKKIFKFTDLGHPVLGATWKTPTAITNFSNYVARKPNNNRGMIATTWFHVQRKEWTIVDDIIQTSGEAFWHAQ